jgi:hypothetical protein
MGDFIYLGGGSLGIVFIVALIIVVAAGNPPKP